MYIDSLFWNFLVLTMQGNVLSTFSTGFFHLIVQPLVLVVIMNNALIGIISSLFLHSLNSILKTFASAIEISLTAILSWALFGIEIKPNTILAIFIVFCSLYIYSKNPVASKSKVNSEILETEKKTSKLEEV